MIIFDIETNALKLDEITTVHCIATYNYDEKKTNVYYGSHIRTVITELENTDVIIGHNIVNFDIPVLQKLYDLDISDVVICDTYILAQLVAFDQLENDIVLAKANKFNSKLCNSHSLEAWGYRLGFLKNTKPKEFSLFNKHMLDYCKQDVLVTKKLFEYLDKFYCKRQTYNLELNIAQVMQKNAKFGFYFDVDKALKFKNKLEIEVKKLSAILQEHFGAVSDSKNKPVVFNPNSTQHVAKKLKEFYGWTPTEFTEKGQAQVTEAILSKLKYPYCIELQEYLLLKKRLAQLAYGRYAWLNTLEDNCIKSRINSHGTVSGRANHSKPNISQVPAVYSKFGKECRELFTVSNDDEYVLVGADASSLELRCLAHFLNDSEYTKQILDGDIHSYNQKLIGLKNRDIAKTFIYAFIYGCGNKALGAIAGGDAFYGAELRKKMFLNIPNLEELKNKVTKKDFFKGLDGRILRSRSKHSALNLLLQSAGAIVCKQWIVNFYEATTNFKLGEDYFLSAWIHDEIQATVKKLFAKQCAKIIIHSLEKVTNDLKLNCAVTGEYKIGRTWAETH